MIFAVSNKKRVWGRSGSSVAGDFLMLTTLTDSVKRENFLRVSVGRVSRLDAIQTFDGPRGIYVGGLHITV